MLFLGLQLPVSVGPLLGDPQQIGVQRPLMGALSLFSGQGLLHVGHRLAGLLSGFLGRVAGIPFCFINRSLSVIFCIPGLLLRSCFLLKQLVILLQFQNHMGTLLVKLATWNVLITKSTFLDKPGHSSSLLLTAPGCNCQPRR